MKKRIKYLMFSVLFSLMMIAPVSVKSEGNTSRLVDNADLLSSGEEEKVLTELNKVSGKYSLDVVVLTVSGLDGKTTVEVADDFYDNNGYSNDGVLLLISMEDRDWYISTKGYGITAFTDAGIQYIGGQIKSDLGDGDYADAFISYAGLCDLYGFCL